MFADKLASAMSTEILLFTIVFFPVFGYIKVPATGHVIAMVICMTHSILWCLCPLLHTL
jgi:hypothetical protein